MLFIDNKDCISLVFCTQDSQCQRQSDRPGGREEIRGL